MEGRYLPLSCFGKLPCSRDYLEINFRHDTARAFQAWVREGRATVAQQMGARTTGGGGPEGGLGRVAVIETRSYRVLFGVRGSYDLMAGLIRPSRDLQGREHPFLISAHFPRRYYGRQYAYLPVGVSAMWSGLAEGWERLGEAASRPGFEEMLPSCEVRTPIPPAEARRRYDRAMSAGSEALFGNGTEAHPDMLREKMPQLISRLKGLPTDGSFTVEFPVAPDIEDAGIAASLWMRLVNRHFLWRRFEPTILIEESTGRGPASVYLVFGSLRARDYGAIMGCGPSSECSFRPAHRDSTQAPGVASGEFPRMGELADSKFS